MSAQGTNPLSKSAEKGNWNISAKLWNEKGELKRPPSQFRNFISNEPGARFRPEKGRYHLYVSYACPWANRALIVRKLKGLEDFISVSSVHYKMSLTDGWRFPTADESLPMDDCTPDPLHPNVAKMKDLYFHAHPDYTGRFTVPLLWDKKLDTIVNNESSEIIRMFNSEFNALLPEDKRGVDLYPERLRKDIDESNEWIYDSINNGVYKCGLAKTQQAYDSAVADLFKHLDLVEAHLSAPPNPGPFYYGSTLSEVDVRLFVTIIRFDPVYVSAFKTNKGMIRYDYPAIHKWVRNLYWNVPAFKETTSFEHIKGHYFESLLFVNPEGIVPAGPVPNILPLEA